MNVPPVEVDVLTTLADHVAERLAEKLRPLLVEHERLLRYSEVAERLACDESHARRLGSSGVLPQVRLGTSVRVRVADLDAFIRDQPVVAGRVRRLA